jgi:hypothetical protein
MNPIIHLFRDQPNYRICEYLNSFRVERKVSKKKVLYPSTWFLEPTWERVYDEENAYQSSSFSSFLEARLFLSKRLDFIAEQEKQSVYTYDTVDPRSIRNEATGKK